MNKAPKIARWILSVTGRDGISENVLGDILEFYNEIVQSSGKKIADKWLWRQTIKSIPVSIRSRFYWGGIMIAKYLKLIFRNMRKRKINSAVNIAGLSIGFAVCLLILQYVDYEKSYDKFFNNYEQIYRVLNYRYYNTGLDKSAGCNSFVGPVINDEFPEVIGETRCRKIETTVQFGENVFKEKRVFFADSSFLTMFSYPVIKGQRSSVLAKPHSAVLAVSTAKKYFGNSDPVGQTIIIGNSTPYLVTGITEDVPENTHLKFDILLSFQSQYSDGFCEYCNNTNTYIRVAKGTKPAELEAKLPTIIAKAHNGEQFTFEREYILQPLEDIHLYSNVRFEHEMNSDGNSVNVLALVAVAILLLAYLNYINLSTAQYAKRFKETGLRRVIGAGRRDIIKQILFESLVYNLISLLAAFIVIMIMIDPVQRVIEHSVSYNLLSNVWFWICLAAVILTGSVFSGLYPAIIMSTSKPSYLLSIRNFNVGRKSLLRKSMIVFQFAVAVVLISGSLIVFEQVSFMRNASIGANIEETVAVNWASKYPDGFDYNNAMESFMGDLLSESSIKEATYTSVIPGTENYDVTGGILLEGKNPEEEQQIYLGWVNKNFVDFFDLNLICGRDFFDNDLTNLFIWSGKEKGVVINESASKAFGFADPENALGKNIVHENKIIGNIAGVIKDYHQQSLDKSIKPTIYFGSKWGTNFVFRINSGDIKNTIALIKEKFLNYYPGNPFVYSFVDEVFDRQYKSDIIFEKIFGGFTLIAIIIACLGLLGLISFTTEQRTKEIGIRKVVGASLFGISYMLVKELIILVLIGNLIAFPLAYYALNEWLLNYAYRIQVSWQTFILSGLATLIIALTTVGYQTIKAGSANPIDSIKYE